MLADSSEPNGSPLSTERLADHGRDKNKEQMPSIDWLQGRRQASSTHHKAINCVCVGATAPLAAEGRKGSDTPYCLASNDPHISCPPYFLIKIWSYILRLICEYAQ